MKQLGEGWNWRDLKIGDKLTTYGRTLFEADLLNFVTLCGFSEELFTNKEYIKEHAPMRGGHPVPGALVYSMAEGLVIPTTLQGSGLAFLSMGFDIKGPTYVNDTIHVEIEVTEIKPTSKDPSRALVRTTNLVKNQRGETVLVYTPLRMIDAPQIEIEMVESTEVPTGLGEPGTTVMAPAIANAIFNAVGVRMRHLPISPDAVLKALKA